MKKRWMICLLALCLLVSGLSGAVLATETTEATEPEKVVRAADECGEGIKWQYEDGVLTITGKGKMDDFSEGTEPWREYKKEIKEVVIKGGVTYVGAYAFKDYDALESVEFGDAMYEIGKEAFRSCDGLTKLWFPEGFKVFGESSFASCKNLKEFYCAGRFPSFRQNCLWDTYGTIFYPAGWPWNADTIAQLEEAFHGRIQFLPSSKTKEEVMEEKDAEDPTEAPTEAPTEVPTETPTEAPTEPETVPEITQPVTEPMPETEPETLSPTEAPATEPAETIPASTEPQKEGPAIGSWIGIVIIGAVAAFLLLGALIFGKGRRKGRFSR